MNYDFDLRKAHLTYPDRVFFIYDPSMGYSCPDDKVEPFVESIIKRFEEFLENGNVFFIGSELIIHGLRVAICEQRIPYKKVVLFYKHHALHVDKNGRIDSWPAGFCDHADKYLEKLIHWGQKDG